MDLRNLQLTERDFQLLVDGLDTLPNKDFAGDIMEGLMMGMLKKDGGDNTQLSDFEKKRQAEKLKKERDKEMLKEDIKILQGKLLMFKRFLIQQDALKQVDDILNPQP
jgi:hypothetical protein